MDAPPTALAGIAFVMVRPEVPGNVGAAARIVRNFGIGDLRIVGDRLHEEGDARRLAHGSLDVLDEARVFDDLSEAIADCERVVGSSGRSGRNARRGETAATVRCAASRLVGLSEAARVAVVFGPESDGLSLRDLAACDEFVQIPQRRPGPSLNLAQAVAIVGSELFQAALVPGRPAPREFAAREDVGRMVSRMSRLARHCGLPVRNRPEQIGEAVHTVFAAHDYSPFDLSVLERWLAQVEWFVGLPSMSDGH